MADITRADIQAAIDGVTGAPSVGIVHDVTPGIVDAIARLLVGDSEVEQRVIKPTETRKVDSDEQ
jgi:hypothetical protein